MAHRDTDLADPRTEVVPVVLDNGVTIHVEATSLGGRRKVATLDPQRFRELTDAIEGIGGALSESGPWRFATGDQLRYRRQRRRQVHPAAANHMPGRPTRARRASHLSSRRHEPWKSSTASPSFTTR